MNFNQLYPTISQVQTAKQEIDEHRGERESENREKVRIKQVREG